MAQQQQQAIAMAARALTLCPPETTPTCSPPERDTATTPAPCWLAKTAAKPTASCSRAFLTVDLAGRGVHHHSGMQRLRALSGFSQAWPFESVLRHHM